MHNLGIVHGLLSDPPDLEAASGWWTRAAEGGHSYAMFAMGNLYERLLVVPDLDNARSWYERAAEAGYVHAMNTLGDLCARAIEPPDLQAARHWYERAAASGYRRAQKNLEALDQDSSGGWGAEPPNEAEIHAMVDWLEGADLEETMEAVNSVMDRIRDAAGVRDTAALKAASADLTRVLTGRLAPTLPTPDPDLNRALRALIDDGEEVNAAVQPFADPPTMEQTYAFLNGMSDMLSSLRTLVWTLERDGEIGEASGF
jgi:hypothetical protein